MFLCNFSDICGKPRTGVHSFRIFDIAIIDFLMTIVGGLIIAKYMKWNILKTIMLLFIIGHILHILFCVDTKFVNILKF